MSRHPASGLSRRLLLGSALGAIAARPLAVSAGPDSSRIAALGGTVTEILYDLGVGDRIVAVDTTSLHPPEALRTKPDVGYLRALSAEGILSTRPTIVIAVEGAGPPDVLKLIGEAGAPLIMIPEDPTEDGVARRIAKVATFVGRDAEGEKLVQDTARRFAALAKLRARIEKPMRALFILSLQNGRVMAGGRNTAADGMLTLAGARNVASAIEGYKAMTDEAIIAAQPEVVVMMDRSSGPGVKAGLFESPSLSRTPAGHDRRLVSMNGLYLLGFGPRTPDAARDLLLAMHPGLKAE